MTESILSLSFVSFRIVGDIARQQLHNMCQVCVRQKYAAPKLAATRHSFLDSGDAGVANGLSTVMVVWLKSRPL
jgi:hypothetical protein